MLRPPRGGLRRLVCRVSFLGGIVVLGMLCFCKNSTVWVSSRMLGSWVLAKTESMVVVRQLVGVGVVEGLR